MTDTKLDNVSYSDDDLDESFDQDVTKLQAKLDNEKNPAELNLGNGISDERMEATLEQLKKLPRDKLLNFLANLKQQVSGKEGDHKFITADEPKRDNYRNALRQKLDQMKLQRSGKKAMQRKLDDLKAAEIEKTGNATGALPTVPEHSESESDESDTEKVAEPERQNKTLKNRKRRERRKRNADKSL
jgi:hypothetical protein